MNLLIKFPSKSRPEKLRYALCLYAIKCSNRANTFFQLTLDEDDPVNTPDFLQDLHTILEPFQHQIILGKSDNKIHAINRDMDQAPAYDILLLASDDMLPEVRGYDEIIRSKMMEHYPDTDGVLWFNDGYAGNRLNTLVCMGRQYYERFHYIYNPIYKSFFCDNEFMDVANKLKKQQYFPQCIIRHQHPCNTADVRNDVLYDQNNAYWKQDEATYYQHKTYDYDLSVLICSIVKRETFLKNLLHQLEDAKARSGLRIEILCDIDDGKLTIGEKRNKLVQQAQGKYSCFIDDDDGIDLDYFKEIEDVLNHCEGADCVSMRGMYYVDGEAKKPFFHSIRYKTYSEDAKGYYRPPNHLNPILTRIVKRVGFPYKNHGEDTDFAMRLVKLNLIHTEATVRKVLYHYYFVSKK